MNKAEFASAARYAGTLPRDETRAQMDKYLCTVAHDNRALYLKAARDCLRWARIDREAGDRESALWYLISANRHRLIAAEWIDRYNRVRARSI